MTEVVITVAIFGILSSIAVASFIFLQKNADLESNIREFSNILKFAQSRTLASESNNRYGVYVDTSVFPNKYTLFQGSNYVSRNSSFDQIYLLSQTTEFSGVNFNGGSEIIFDKLTGATSQPGNISIRLKTDASQIKTAYVSNSGIISLTPPAEATDSRIKDSRHIHFNYGRAIDINSEKITFIFDNSVIKEIPIGQNIIAGQFYWEGIIDVGGESQTVKIHTHRLNNPDTQFSVHRDRRYNTKSLNITVLGDSSGNLAQYSADGLITNYSSIYVSEFIWQ